MRKARELGLDVVYAQYPNAYDSEHWPYVDQALLLDYADADRLLPLARALHEAYPFRTAVTLTEFGLLSAALINEALGLDGESLEVVELLLDKWRMRQHLSAKGISPVASAVGRSTQDVRDFVEAHGLPIIVKPVRESGSLAVFHVREPAEVEVVAEEFLALADKDWNWGDVMYDDSFEEFLMEEYLDGPELSVESLTYEGRHVIVAITDYVKGGITGFAEIGMSYPSAYPAETQHEIKELVTDFLDAVGLRNGPAHTEVKLTAVACGSSSRTTASAVTRSRRWSRSRTTSTWSSTRWPAGSTWSSRWPRRPSHSAEWLSGHDAEPGRVVEVTGVDAVEADPTSSTFR